MSAELEARRTAAAAVGSDFTREGDAYLDADGPRPDFDAWAWRLHSALRSLLDEMDRPRPRIDGSEAATDVRPDGSATLGPADLVTARNALADAVMYRAAQRRQKDKAAVIAYRALAWVLGSGADR